MIQWDHAPVLEWLVGVAIAMEMAHQQMARYLCEKHG